VFICSGSLFIRPVRATGSDRDRERFNSRDDVLIHSHEVSVKVSCVGRVLRAAQRDVLPLAEAEAELVLAQADAALLLALAHAWFGLPRATLASLWALARAWFPFAQADARLARGAADDSALCSRHWAAAAAASFVDPAAGWSPQSGGADSRPDQDAVQPVAASTREGRAPSVAPCLKHLHSGAEASMRAACEASRRLPAELLTCAASARCEPLC
jgi:hypothetical protein